MKRHRQVTDRPANLSVYRMREQLSRLTPEHIEQLTAGRDARRFVPEWGGFATSPAGTLQCCDLGPCAVIWSTGGTMVGESNGPTFTLSNVPDELHPRSRRLAADFVIDDGALEHGGCAIDSSGVLTFHRCLPADSSASTTYLVPDTAGFTPSGRKGLPPNWAVMYPK
jgi:hypothetical protein